VVVVTANNGSSPIRDLCPSETDPTRGCTEIGKTNAGGVRTEDSVHVLEERVANNPGWVRVALAGERRRATVELEDEKCCETVGSRNLIDDEVLRRDFVANTAKGEGYNRLSVAGWRVRKSLLSGNPRMSRRYTHE
jgi:hypothetical protein